MMTTGEKLAALRREKGLTQEQLAEALNVSRQSVSRWEMDAAFPETDKLIRLSRWVCECEVIKTVAIDISDTFFCRVRNVQLDETIVAPPFTGPSPGLNLTQLNPIIYSGDYHSIGQHLGMIGDFYKP